MKKYHIFLLTLLGLFLVPNNVMACGKDSVKHSCQKEITTKSEKMSCCDSKESNEEKDCNGNCGHSTCDCASTGASVFSISFPYEVNFKIHFLNYSLVEKVNFSHTTSAISDGFYSIWLLPKIS